MHCGRTQGISKSFFSYYHFRILSRSAIPPSERYGSGGKLPADATILVLLGSANRDERKFPDPDRFDVEHNPPDHVGFGYGIHYCLGAPLARLEGRMALEALLFACPPFTRVREHLPRIATYLVRGPQTLPLRFAIPHPTPMCET